MIRRRKPPDGLVTLESKDSILQELKARDALCHAMMMFIEDRRLTIKPCEGYWEVTTPRGSDGMMHGAAQPTLKECLKTLMDAA